MAEVTGGREGAEGEATEIEEEAGGDSVWAYLELGSESGGGLCARVGAGAVPASKKRIKNARKKKKKKKRIR